MNNRLETETGTLLPLEARPKQAVAAIIVDRQTNLIYTVVEKESHPEYGKEAGMRTHPMETIDTDRGQTEEEALDQLFDQEVHEKLVRIGAEFIGYYGVDVAAVKLYLIHVERNGVSHNGNEDGYNHNVRRDEVTDPRWMKPEDLLLERVRMGVHEMIEDCFSGRRDVRRECRPVPLSNPSNGAQNLKY